MLPPFEFFTILLKGIFFLNAARLFNIQYDIHQLLIIKFYVNTMVFDPAKQMSAL